MDKPQARQAFGGFRGAALNQSHSASGVYTGLSILTLCGIDRNRAMWQRKMRLRSISRMMGGR
ncbi:TPA_asm: hypothetical protein G4I83_004581 [Salmonella enterica subsp. enterica serovar Javiana]|nr:hypothetical protein [Salmonella enterica subsp. enterica serovar Javiana]